MVAAAPPLKPVLPGLPWQAWQAVRSFLASRPWKAELVAESHTAPRACGAVAGPWQRVLLKQPGAVPAGAGLAGCPAGFAGAPG